MNFAPAPAGAPPSMLLEAVKDVSERKADASEDDKQVVGLVRLLLHEPTTAKRLNGSSKRIGMHALGAALAPQVTLDLSYMGLVDEDIAILVDCLAATPMPFLDGLAPPGKAGLTPAPLLAIDLRGNSITDVGAVLLSNLLASPHTDAHGMDVSLTATGIRHAEEGHHVASRLSLLDLRDNRISAVGK